MEQEIFYAMALTRLTNFNYQQALELYRAVGSAQMLMTTRNGSRNALMHLLYYTTQAMLT